MSDNPTHAGLPPAAVAALLNPEALAALNGAEARPALEIARALRDAGHMALLAGGCVRDLLLGRTPTDYDVATDATPQRVGALFRATRQVGAQFGVVLVRGPRWASSTQPSLHAQRKWVEVATFRCDGTYSDGRRPDSVTFGDARADALRRDFTVNGMFLDPQGFRVIDYVGGRADLERRLVRAIGGPAARFEEDHLRLLRAVRFAARLGFEIEPATLAAICANASKLARVAAERVLDELVKMLGHASRATAVRWLARTGLATFVCPGLTWSEGRPEAAQPHEPAIGPLEAAARTMERLPADAPFELAFAILLADRAAAEIDRVCRALASSNEQRETVLWLVRHQADLDEPRRPTLAELKRLMANPAFAALRAWAEARYAGMRNAECGMENAERRTQNAEGAAAVKGDRDLMDCRRILHERLGAIRPEDVAPAPLVNGNDLAARGVPPGPIYKRVLDELYTRQLDEEIRTRAAALREMEAMLQGPIGA